MSITSMAQDSALRLTPGSLTTTEVAVKAAESAVDAVRTGASTAEAIAKGTEDAKAAKAEGGTIARSASSGPLSQLVKYIPTETIALYIAAQGALGTAPASNAGGAANADFTGQWIIVGSLLIATFLLTIGLSYRSQKDANRGESFKFPIFESLAASAAFLVWAFSLPGTPLNDFPGYSETAWSSFIILAGTIAIGSAAHILGKSISWQKISDVEN